MCASGLALWFCSLLVGKTKVSVLLPYRLGREVFDQGIRFGCGTLQIGVGPLARDYGGLRPNDTGELKRSFHLLKPVQKNNPGAKSIPNKGKFQKKSTGFPTQQLRPSSLGELSSSTTSPALLGEGANSEHTDTHTHTHAHTSCCLKKNRPPPELPKGRALSAQRPGCVRSFSRNRKEASL